MPEYMLAVHGVEGENPYSTPEEMQAAFDAVDKFNTKATEAGVWVFGGGLEPAGTATVIDATKGGDPLVTDGPFVEGKEHLGGFWVIKVDDLDAALRWAEEASVACRNPVEVRPFQGDTEELNEG